MNKAQSEDYTTALADYSQRMSRAVGRVGRTPGNRLRWVLDFVKRDILRMDEEERIAAGDNLRALHDSERWHAPYSSGLTMPDRLLKRIHRELQDCFRVLFSEDPANVWRVPLPKSSDIHRMNRLTSKKTRFQQYFTADERVAVIGSVLDLLLQCQDQVRACARCKQPFVRNRRQAYCTEDCGQKERNYRKKIRPT